MSNGHDMVVQMQLQDSCSAAASGSWRNVWHVHTVNYVKSGFPAKVNAQRMNFSLEVDYMIIYVEVRDPPISATLPTAPFNIWFS